MALNFDGKKYFQGITLSFLVVQAVSWLLHAILDVPLIKIGFLLILALIIVLIVSLYTVGSNLDKLDLKTIIFVLIVFGGVVALILLLPSILPEIFSAYNPSAIQYSEAIRQNLNSILSWG